MCFANREDATKNSVNPFGTGDHILRILNSGSWTDKTFDYVVEAAKNINQKLSSPESTLILRNLFNLTFVIRPNTPRTPTESIYGTTILREEEDCVDYTMFEVVLKDYINNDIKKNFNLSVSEYLQLTPFEKISYDKVSIDFTKKLAEEVSKIEQKSNKDVANISKGLDMEGTLDEY